MQRVEASKSIQGTPFNWSLQLQAAVESRVQEQSKVALHLMASLVGHSKQKAGITILARIPAMAGIISYLASMC